MKQLTCELCGGTDLIKAGDVFICKGCGCKYSLEEAKALLSEKNDDVPESVVKMETIEVAKPETSKEESNLRILAQRSFGEADYAAAAGYYEKILLINPNDIEASLYSSYCKAYASKIGELADYLASTGNRTISTLKMMKTGNTNDSGSFSIDKVVKEFTKVQRFCQKALNEYLVKNLTTADASLVERGRAAHKTACYTVAQILCDDFHRSDLAVETYMCYRSSFNSSAAAYADASNHIYRLKPEQRQIDTDAAAKAKAEKKGGCYVATAVYGSYDCPQVWTLRRYRDYTLAETWYGRAFVHTYYAISPTLVKWFGRTEWFKKMWKGKLDRMVRNLQAKGVADTPYNDRVW